MRKTLLEIYALAVCFVTLSCFVIALGIGLYDVVELSNPAFTLDQSQFEKHQTNEKFLAKWPKDKPTPPRDRVTALRKESYQLTLYAERRSALQSLIKVGIILLIGIIVFAVHWRLAAKARQASPAS